MPPQALVVPVDLATVGLAMFLRIALRGLDRGAGVDEEERGHDEGGERSDDCLLWGWEVNGEVSIAALCRSRLEYIDARAGHIKDAEAARNGIVFVEKKHTREFKLYFLVIL